MENIHAPRNTVELDIRLVDLQVLIDSEQVEARDWVLRDADTLKGPEPDDLVLARDVKRLGRDRADGVLDGAGEPFVAVRGDGDDTAELKSRLC